MRLGKERNGTSPRLAVIPAKVRNCDSPRTAIIAAKLPKRTLPCFAVIPTKLRNWGLPPSFSSTTTPKTPSPSRRKLGGCRRVSPPRKHGDCLQVFRPQAWLLLLLAFPLHATEPRPMRVCATCHPAQAKPHPETSMSHAAELVAECGVLKTHPVMTFASKGYSYKIERSGDQSSYSVSDGTATLTVPINWAFGLGNAGQTYVLEKDGLYYESFISYYKQIDKLDLTMGDQKFQPTTLMEAMGRPMGEREKAACFNCHNTSSVNGAKLTLNTMAAGVQCERCHGETANHLAGIKKGDPALFAMKKLSALTSEETNNFCGQCHRTWEQIASNGPRGTLNVRFQPYRLTNSRCYDVDDKRIACTACHDPHKEIDRVSTNYDVKCQSCHAGGKPEAKACKVATSDCASCHMPKVELPGSHHQFSDHDIRIVRAKSAYPD